jgi:hypothetical protein
VIRIDESCTPCVTTSSRTLVRLFVCLIALLSAAALPLQGQAQQPEKYRLVYVVAADVAVEPLFFTNGNDVVLLYDYCWVAYMKNPPRGSSLRPAQIADDVKSINQYCDYNKNITLDGSKFHTLNNNGESVRVGKIEFNFAAGGEGPLKSRGSQLSPLEIGRTKIVDVSANSSNVVHANTTERYRFHFMASSASLLKQILPPRRADPQEEARLLK